MTSRQHKFCIAYIETRNPREASLMAGYSDVYSKTKSYALLKNPAIKEKIDYLSKEYYQSEFQKLALDAVATLKDVLGNELSPASQMQAIKLSLILAGVINRHGDVDRPETQTVFKLVNYMEEGWLGDNTA